MLLMILLILLDQLPIFTIGGWFITGIVAVISWLFHAALSSEREKRRQRDDMVDAKFKTVESDIKDLQIEDRRTNEKVSDVNLKILSEINAVAIKLAEFKSTLSK